MNSDGPLHHCIRIQIQILCQIGVHNCFLGTKKRVVIVFIIISLLLFKGNGGQVRIMPYK